MSSPSETTQGTAHATNFDLEQLKAITEQFRKVNPWRFCAVKPSAHGRLLRECRRPVASASPCPCFTATGIVIEPRPGQVMEAWFFADVTLFRAYLRGGLSEEDLIELWTAGKVLTDGFPLSVMGAKKP